MNIEAVKLELAQTEAQQILSSLKDSARFQRDELGYDSTADWIDGIAAKVADALQKARARQAVDSYNSRRDDQAQIRRFRFSEDANNARIVKYGEDDACVYVGHTPEGFLLARTVVKAEGNITEAWAGDDKWVEIPKAPTVYHPAVTPRYK